MPPPRSTTKSLQAWSNGHQSALDKLVPHIYNEPCRLAEHYLRRERPNHTLQPTALIHEAYRAARRSREGHRAAKQGGPERKVTLDEAAALA